MLNTVDEFYGYTQEFYSLLNGRSRTDSKKAMETWTGSYIKDSANFHQSMRLLDSITAKLTEGDFSTLDAQGMTVQFPEHVLVVGCGGIGSWFLPKFVKLVNDAKRKNLLPSTSLRTLTICDGDEVETSNLIRQNFSSRDVNKKKAEVLFKRYGVELNPNITFGYIDKYLLTAAAISIKPEEQKDKFVSWEDYMRTTGIDKRTFETVLIINLIDNNESRKDFHGIGDIQTQTVYGGGLNLMYIDVANSVYNGQLNMSLPLSVTNRGLVGAGRSNYINFTNNLKRYYDTIPENNWLNDRISVFDCSVRDANAVEQLFDINSMGAQILCSYLNTWMEKGKLYTSEIQFSSGSNMGVRTMNKLHDLYVDTSDNMRLRTSQYDIDDSSGGEIRIFKRNSQIVGKGTPLYDFFNNARGKSGSNKRLIRSLINMSLQRWHFKDPFANVFERSFVDLTKASNGFSLYAMPKEEIDKYYGDNYSTTFMQRQQSAQANQKILEQIF